MGDRPESDGTVWTPPPQSIDRDGLVEEKVAEAVLELWDVPTEVQGAALQAIEDEAKDIARAALAVVERERPDDPACSDPTCSYRAELAFQRERPRDVERGVTMAGNKNTGVGLVERERPSVTLLYDCQRSSAAYVERCDGCPGCRQFAPRERPSLTEEDWKTVHWCMIVAESRAINGMDVTVRELRNRLWRAFASSTTEERYEAAERLRRRQDDPRTQERSLTAWREEDESTTEEQER